jgi:SAM-dependent methyltransferase
VSRPWFPAIAEREHDLQNPTSPEKIRLLGERLRLGPKSRVLDLACGRGGPAIVLASTFGCRILGVEKASVFAAAARERVAAASLGELVEIGEGDAAAFPLEPEAWDVALCLGASFVWGGLEPTVAALAPAVRSGGHVVVGEPYWRRWPLPAGIDDEGFVGLPETVERFERGGLALITLVASSRDDWDRYETLHWRSVEEWFAAHRDEPGADEVRTRQAAFRAEYLDVKRELFGWAIFAGWKRPQSEPSPSETAVSMDHQLRGSR